MKLRTLAILMLASGAASLRAQSYQWSTVASQPGASSGYIDGRRSVARFSVPSDIAVDGSGHAYVADLVNDRIRKVTPGGMVSTLTDPSGQPIVIANARCIAADASGNVYVGDFATDSSSSGVIRKIDPSGRSTVLASGFYGPRGIAVDGSGTVYAVEFTRSALWKITPDGKKTMLVGFSGLSGYADGPAASASLANPSDVCVSADGTLYIADSGNHMIRKLTPDGLVSTLAGSSGDATSPDGSGGNDGTGRGARFNSPNALDIDTAGNLYVGEFNNRIIRRVSPDGVVTTIGGTLAATGQVDGLGAAARFSAPEGVALDLTGRIYVVDANRVVIGTAASAAAGRMVVDQPSGTALSSGLSTVDFGSGGARTFTITNVGLAALNVGALSISGVNAGDFAVSVPPASSSLAVGASTTFTVAFSAGAASTRLATLSVSSNDSSVSPFVVALRGNAGAVQVSLEPVAEGPGAAALWQIDGGAWHPSGATVQGLISGQHSIAFLPVNGWATPATQSISVNANATANVTGTYVAQGTGSVQVNLAGGTGFWDVDDRIQSRAGGTVLSGLSHGEHTVLFYSVDGYVTPEPLVFNVIGGQTTVLNAGYAAASPVVHVEHPPGVAWSSGQGQLSFGALARGDTAQRVLEVSNSGTGSLFHTVSLSGPHAADFRIVTETDLRYKVGSDDQIVIEFSPQGTGTRTATLTIADYDGRAANFTMALTGELAGGVTPFSQWQWRNPQPHGNGLGNVVYGNGKFLAVGDAGTVMTSVDGQNWSTQPALTSAPLYDVIYDGSQFMAVGSGGKVFTSPDGTTWTDRSGGSASVLASKPIYGVAYGNGRHVVVAGNASTNVTGSFSAWSSDGGNTWTQDTTLGGGYYWRVAFGAGRFVAVGPSGKVVTSTSGQAWSQRSSGAGWLSGITFANGRFIAYGDGTTTSTDGLTWTNHLITGYNSYGLLSGVAYGDGTWVIAPEIQSASNGMIDAFLSSSDSGTTWTPRQSVADKIQGIAFGANTFVAVGEAGAIYHSADAVAWTRIQAKAVAMRAMAAGPGAVVGVSIGGGACVSSDGISWSNVSTPTTENLSGVAAGGGLFVAVGSSGTILSSPTGHVWTARTSGTTRDLRSIAYGNGRFVGVGELGRVVHSTDGITWARLTLDDELRDVCFGNGHFAAVGDNTVWVSNDGISWSKRVEGNGITFGTVAAGNGRIVAPHANGIGVFVSTDQEVWTLHPAPVFGSIQDITFDGRAFIAVGYATGGTLSQSEVSASTIMTSFDGITWLRHSPPVNGSLNGVVSVGGMAITGGVGVLTSGQASAILVLEQPSGTGLVDGSSSVDFGSVVAPGTTDRTFTVRNVGGAVLNSITLSIDGAQANAFSVMGAPATSIAVGGSSSFTLRFSPMQGGVHQALLHIASNDSASTFDVALMGGGAGGVAFAAQKISVLEEAGTAHVTLMRSGDATGTASVQVTSASGTASSPADFLAVNTIINFAAAETTKDIDVTLVSDAAAKESNETFALTLSNVTGSGVLLGTPSTCTVTIIDAYDVTLPTVTITSPLANAIILEASGPSVNVTGSAKDNQGLSAVEVALDGGAFTAATLTLSADTKTGTFAKSVNLGSGGTHSIAVRSIDTRGNQSIVVSRSVVHRIVRPLTVSINDSTRGTITTGFVPTSNRNVGERYTVTATPRPGYVFSSWTANSFTGTGVTSLAAELPSLSFLMQDGLNLTANFIANPFISSVIGTFNGLVTPQAGTATGVDTVGMLQNVRVTSTGTFTSTLRIDGLSLPVNGAFTTTGAARFGSGATRSTELTLTRAGKPSLIVALSLDMNGVNGITGTLRQRLRGADIAVSSINARRAAYSSTAPIVSTLGAAVPKPYTLLFPSLTQSPAIGAEFYPQSPGYATMTVSAAGVVNFVGKLADHTIINGSADVITGNAFPLFASLYSGKGVLAGSAQLTDANSSSYDVTAAVPLLWVRPIQTTSQWYPDGWSEGIALDVVGARYAVPIGTPAASVFPGLQAINPNATLSFSGGLLTSPVTFGQSISALNVVINVPLSPTGPTMTITKATGLVTGSLPHTDGTRPFYQGVIMQKGALKGAWGYFMSRATPLTYLGESGTMSAVAQ